MERPILFSAEMVRAILDGRKTQTRRVIKPQPLIGCGWGNGQPQNPYGRPGDRLWVREAWGVMFDEDIWHQNKDEIHYMATDEKFFESFKGRPSIHMPRWASRITLEIINTRIERVREIPTTDAWQEGCPHSDVNAIKLWFKPLWDSINAKRGFEWDKNPWVWVIEFKRANTTCDTCPGISTIACQVCR